MYYIVQVFILLCPSSSYQIPLSLKHCNLFSNLLLLSVGLPVPVPQAIADPEPADLDRIQRGSVPVILSAAL